MPPAHIKRRHKPRRALIVIFFTLVFLQSSKIILSHFSSLFNIPKTKKYIFFAKNKKMYLFSGLQIRCKDAGIPGIISPVPA
jgi:hypothetical protein